jgi:phosphohistidine swiveling domain-containing protein
MGRTTLAILVVFTFAAPEVDARDDHRRAAVAAADEVIAGEIPVVGVTGATRRIADGAIIEVDGERGTVEVIDQRSIEIPSAISRAAGAPGR